MFAFKKAIGPLLFPIPILVVLFAIGILFLWFSKRQRLGKVIVTTTLVLLVLGSWGPLVKQALWSLEGQYPVYQPRPGIEWVVVLGGGVSDDPALPPGSQLSLPSLARVVEGSRILSLHPEARMIVSGGMPSTTFSEGSVMGTVAMQCGVDSSRIVYEEASLDTKDQAQHIKAFVGDAPFVLVTSATHMPRSMAMFRKQGLDPIAAPTDFFVRHNQGPSRISAYYPSSLNLRGLRQVFYEYIGLTWARLRGQV